MSAWPEAIYLKKQFRKIVREEIQDLIDTMSKHDFSLEWHTVDTASGGTGGIEWHSVPNTP